MQTAHGGVEFGADESPWVFLERAGQIDAVANAAGSVPWKPFAELGHQDFQDALTGKTLSQVELVRQRGVVGHAHHHGHALPAQHAEGDVLQHLTGGHHLGTLRAKQAAR